MNFKILTISILSVFLLNSCSSNEEKLDSDKNSIFGTYELESYNTVPSTDINNDGIASENQALESSCHQNFSITLNEDNTSVVKYTFLELERDSNNMETQQIECYVSDRSGTFTVEGDVLTLSYDSDGVIEKSIFNIDGNKITGTSESIDLLTRNSEGKLVYVNASLIVILEK
ncbi:lipocalin family protein [Tamlana sp. I1]|uniref:lipocalin family protein n=1 Tax=Tamlana sp. I1 TaxID=2762061 RepID=UPI00188E0F04|nr:lipocalin family protein [Tamlana sp. I1]